MHHIEVRPRLRRSVQAGIAGCSYSARGGWQGAVRGGVEARDGGGPDQSAAAAKLSDRSRSTSGHGSFDPANR